MAKKVKFPLDMGNDVFVRTLDELKENYNTEKVTEYFLDGRLLTWLDDRYYEDEAVKVRELSEKSDKNSLAVKLGSIFGIKIEEEVDVEALEIRKEKLEKLRRITSDDNILDNVDSVAFSQEDLGDLLDEETEVIYLCGVKFHIPLGVKNTKYIGVNKPIISIGGNGVIDLEANGISFENCEFAADVKGRLKPEIGGKSVDVKEVPDITDEVAEECVECWDEECDDEFTDDDAFELEVNKGRVTLTDYSGDYEVIIIPDIVNEIGNSAFENCSARKIVIPDSVEKICDSAFSGCCAEEIFIADGVETIEDSAFYECDNLKKINLPDSMSEFGDNVFNGCKKLESIEIPDGIYTIGNSCFCDCVSLKRISLPESLEEIGYESFSNCENLIEINIPEGVTTIGECAFSGCTNLKKVYLPDSIEVLGEEDNEDSDVFEDCPNVAVEYDGRKYKYGQLKSLYIKINCQ